MVPSMSDICLAKLAKCVPHTPMTKVGTWDDQPRKTACASGAAVFRDGRRKTVSGVVSGRTVDGSSSRRPQWRVRNRPLDRWGFHASESPSVFTGRTRRRKMPSEATPKRYFRPTRRQQSTSSFAHDDLSSGQINDPDRDWPEAVCVFGGEMLRRAQSLRALNGDMQGLRGLLLSRCDGSIIQETGMALCWRAAVGAGLIDEPSVHGANHSGQQQHAIIEPQTSLTLCRRYRSHHLPRERHERQHCRAARGRRWRMRTLVTNAAAKDPHLHDGRGSASIR